MKTGRNNYETLFLRNIFERAQRHPTPQLLAWYIQYLLHPWCQIVHFYIDGFKLVPVSNWSRCQIVPFTLLVSNWSGVKLTPVSNWYRCQIGLGVKLGRCQIDPGVKLVLVSICHFYTLGVKLVRCQIDSGVKLTPVSNWCRCQIVLHSLKGILHRAGSLSLWPEYFERLFVNDDAASQNIQFLLHTSCYVTAFKLCKLVWTEFTQIQVE